MTHNVFLRLATRILTLLSAWIVFTFTAFFTFCVSRDYFIIITPSRCNTHLIHLSLPPFQLILTFNEHESHPNDPWTRFNVLSLHSRICKQPDPCNFMHVSIILRATDAILVMLLYLLVLISFYVFHRPIFILTVVPWVVRVLTLLLFLQWHKASSLHLQLLLTLQLLFQ